MVDFSKILEPNKFKIILSALFFIPILTLLIVIHESSLWYYLNSGYYTPFNLITLPLLVLVSLFFSYFLASFIDHYVASRTVKLTIAIASGLATLLIIYVFYKMITEPIVCDPIHKPTTNSSYHSQVLNDIKVDQKSVEESLNRCLSRLGK